MPCTLQYWTRCMLLQFLIIMDIFFESIMSVFEMISPWTQKNWSIAYWNLNFQVILITKLFFSFENAKMQLGQLNKVSFDSFQGQTSQNHLLHVFIFIILVFLCEKVGILRQRKHTNYNIDIVAIKHSKFGQNETKQNEKIKSQMTDLQILLLLL